MILVDSSVWIHYFNGVDNASTDLLEKKLATDLIIIGDLILTEVLQGFRATKDFNTAKQLLLQFDYMDIVNQRIAIKSAENYRYLRSKGLTVRKTIDVLIATFCIENHIQLLRNDNDFNPLVKHLGLQVVNAHSN